MADSRQPDPSLSPDDVQDESDVLSEENTPVYYVGVGASAGGLEAIEAFFNHMPAESGFAFIVVQHLSPDYKSLMVELLSKRTEMQVFRAEEGLLVQRNCVYLIPPKKNLAIAYGKLLLSEQDHSRGINLPIDIFLRSLAEDQGEKAIGIILSGTGSDGMRGIRAIKEYGGMVMVQDPDSAKFDGMPRSAISTGLVDFLLPPEEMPGQLLSFAEHPCLMIAEGSKSLISDEEGLARIFAMLRDKTRVDFTYYKPSTVIRRIERRMTVNQIRGLGDYVRFMESYPSEVSSLYRELLIGVTSFFRDRGAFDILAEKVVPELMGSERGHEVRLWIAGCSTGEEAYSLAILCREVMDVLGEQFKVKVFATDVDKDAIHRAGAGTFPESIAADLSPQILSKYFVRKNENFHVVRAIREMVVFAQHNIIKDPPFTHIHLISCRNLLIYLQPVLQRRVLEMFSFSLNPKGILFLGTSETVGELGEYFEPINNKWKIYRSRGRRPATHPNQELLPTYGSQSGLASMRLRVNRHLTGHREEDRLIDRLLQGLAADCLPLTLVVNEQMELVHVLGDTQGYLKVPPGKMQNDVTRMTERDLALPLATGLQKVFTTMEEVRFSNMRIRQHDSVKLVQVRIKPLPGRKGAVPLAIVLIEEVPANQPSSPLQELQSFDITREAQQRISDLEQELQFTKENLQATIEELETSNEELQATNEELLASNEELQSTNEELQSVNEELFTVNAEYQSKISELTELTNDIDNLLSSTQIATLFLDEELEIRKFTPQVTQIYRILDTDVGRPIHHLSHCILNADPMDSIRAMQEFSWPVEKEVETEEGRWYLMRVLPYHVGPQSVAGVVITFFEVTKLKETQSALARSESLRTEQGEGDGSGSL